MAQDTSAFDAALKDIYEGPIREQLNAKTRLLDIFTKEDMSQQKWEGRQVVRTLRKSRNAGVKATAESGLLPSAGRQGYVNQKIPMRFIEGRIELTTQVMKAARSDKGSFARAMDTEQKGLVDDLARQRNRMLAGFGQGTLALLNGAIGGGGATTMVVDAPGNVAGSVNGTRFIKAGMVLAFHDQAAPSTTIDAVRTVDSITNSTTFELTASAANLDDNAPITLGVTIGGTNEGSYGIEPMGILGIVDSTTYVSNFQNIDRSTAANAFFRSVIMASVGAISSDILQRGIDNAEELSGEVIDCFLCHPSVRRELLKLTESDRRYAHSSSPSNDDAGTSAGAFKKDLTFNGIPVRVDKDLPYGTLIGVVKSHLSWYPEVEGEWADEDGAVLARVADKDNYEARYRVFENFSSDRGNCHVRFDGVTATVTSGVYAD